MDMSHIPLAPRTDKNIQLCGVTSPLTGTYLDEGAGFEISKVPDPLAEENLLRESGRGILLMQAFVAEAFNEIADTDLREHMVNVAEIALKSAA